MFDVPERGRKQLEQALLDKGVNLPETFGTGADPAEDDH